MIANMQVAAIIHEAKPNMLALMKDAFGNYVVQKMLQRARPQDKKWILHCICGEEEAPPKAVDRVVALSRDHHSCRVIQTALQVPPTPTPIPPCTRKFSTYCRLSAFLGQVS
jgi:hypothetical protein